MWHNCSLFDGMATPAYQYVRFNLYCPDQPPRELEDWVESDHHLDESAMKKVLMKRQGAPVTVIKMSDVSFEQLTKRQRVH